MSNKQTVGQACFGKAKIPHQDDILNEVMLRKGFKPTLPLIDKETHLGFEVEVERILRDSHIGLLSAELNSFLWRNTNDNSLRNNGKEFVSIPVKGSAVEFSLSTLEEHLSKDKTCVGHEFTDRTSVHVHMNAQDLTAEQYGSFLLTYLVVEPLLYNFVGGDRDKNIFCVPICDSTLTGVLATLFYDVERDDVKSLCRNLGVWQKYTGLNLLPTLNYGTIEFRHMPGTKDTKKLMVWANLILSIKKFAKDTPYARLKEFIFNLNTTSEYLNFIQNVFDDNAKYLDISNLQQSLESTSAFIKDVFSSSEVSQKVLEEPSKLGYKAFVSSLLLEMLQKNNYIRVLNIEAEIAKYKGILKEYEESRIKLQKQLADAKEIAESLLSTPSKVKAARSVIKDCTLAMDRIDIDVSHYARTLKKLEQVVSDIPIKPSTIGDLRGHQVHRANENVLRQWRIEHGGQANLANEIPRPGIGQRQGWFVIDEAIERQDDDDEVDF